MRDSKIQCPATSTAPRRTQTGQCCMEADSPMRVKRWPKSRLLTGRVRAKPYLDPRGAGIAFRTEPQGKGEKHNDGAENAAVGRSRVRIFPCKRPPSVCTPDFSLSDPRNSHCPIPIGSGVCGSMDSQCGIAACTDVGRHGSRGAGTVRPNADFAELRRQIRLEGARNARVR